MIAWFIANFGSYIAAAGAGIAALVGFWFKAKAEGRKQEQARQLEAQRKAVNTKREIDDEVHGMGDPALDRRLEHWVRKP